MFFGSLRCFLEKTACKVQSKKSQTFVILSVATRQVARRSRSKKIHTTAVILSDSEKSTNSIFSSPFFVFCVDTSANASVWQGKAIWQGFWDTSLCYAKFSMTRKKSVWQNLRFVGCHANFWKICKFYFKRLWNLTFFAKSHKENLLKNLLASLWKDFVNFSSPLRLKSRSFRRQAL